MNVRALLARSVRRFKRLCDLLASELRKGAVRLAHPGVQIDSRTYLGPGLVMDIALDAQVEIVDCHISRHVTIGAAAGAELHLHCDYIGPGSTVVARDSVRIGQGTKIAEQAVIRDGNHDHSVPLRDMAFVASPVAIGRDVWVGAGACVLAGVEVGDSVTIGARAVVTKDVAEGSTVAGVPARVIKTKSRVISAPEQ